VKIFLTGATGFVGREVVRQLHGVGHKVRCLVRDPEKAKQLLPVNVELHPGDLMVPESFSEGVNGCQTVIHLVGIIVEKGRSTFERIHIQGTRNVVDASSRGEIRQFIFMSALGSRKSARTRYHQTKHDAEQVIIRSGMNWTIFRPSIIFGPGDRFVNRLAGMIRSFPIVPVIGRGASRIQPIAVRDVASCLALAIGNPVSQGRIYELGGPGRLTYFQVYQLLAGILEKQRRFIHIPISLIRPGAFLLERIMSRPPITREQLMLLQEDNICDPIDAIRDFNLVFQDFEEGVREYIRG